MRNFGCSISEGMCPLSSRNDLSDFYEKFRMFNFRGDVPIELLKMICRIFMRNFRMFNFRGDVPIELAEMICRIFMRNFGRSNSEGMCPLSSRKFSKKSDRSIYNTHGSKVPQRFYIHFDDLDQLFAL